MWRLKVLGWLEVNQRSQTWLAQRAQLNPSYFNRALKGKHEPSDTTLAKLERAMDMRKGTLAEANAQVALTIEVEDAPGPWISEKS